MNSMLFAAFSLVIASGAAANAADNPFKHVNCKTATMQIEMNYCAAVDFNAADDKLNALYRKLISRYAGDDRKLLQAAEREWIAYRDAECAFETNLSAGGSMHPMVESFCLADKTRARIKELAAQLHCSESDAECNPPR